MLTLHTIPRSRASGFGIPVRMWSVHGDHKTFQCAYWLLGRTITSEWVFELFLDLCQELFSRSSNTIFASQVEHCFIPKWTIGHNMHDFKVRIPLNNLLQMCVRLIELYRQKPILRAKITVSTISKTGKYKYCIRKKTKTLSEVIILCWGKMSKFYV